MCFLDILGICYRFGVLRWGTGCQAICIVAALGTDSLCIHGVIESLLFRKKYERNTLNLSACIIISHQSNMIILLKDTLMLCTVSTLESALCLASRPALKVVRHQKQPMQPAT